MNRRKIDDTLLSQMLAEGKTYKEIGQVMGVSAPAICKRLKRIRLMNPPDSFKQLSPKEQSFALAIAEGKSQTKAAIDAFECSSLQSAKALGSQLAAKDDVKLAISDLLEQAGLGRQFRFKKLKGFVEHQDAGIGLSALKEACKIGEDYPVNKNLNLNATFDISPIDISRYLIKYDENGNRVD